MTDHTGHPTVSVAGLAGRLGLHEWQVHRAVRDGLLPAPDRARGWSTGLADQVTTDHPDPEVLRTAIGTVPDLGGWAVAEHWAGWCGLTEVALVRDAVRELARTGVLRVADRYKGHPVYDGRTVQAVTDPAVVVAAAETGRTLTAGQAATRLGVRRVDFDHLTRAGLVRPVRRVRTYYRSKRRDPGMCLYRAADIDTLATQPDIGGVPLATVRALTAGRRSPWAALPTARNRP